jgi:putative transposase
MATPSMDITSFVGKLLEQDDVDALREGVRVLAQIVMDTEVSAQIGAGHYERSLERTAYRNGYRTRRWDTRTGTIELKIPKLTAGAYFPSAGAASAGGEGTARGRRGGLREGGLDPQGR